MRFITHRLWILLLTLSLIQLRLDAQNLRLRPTFAFAISCVIFYLICSLYELGLLCLISYAAVILLLILVILIEERKYTLILFIASSAAALLLRDRNIAYYVRITFITFNLFVLLDIVRIPIYKN